MFISPLSQLTILVAVAVGQVSMSSIWFVDQTGKPIPVLAENKSYIAKHCDGDDSTIRIFVNLLLSIFFMVSCTYYSFKIRKFPKNYNEASTIATTLYVSCITWALFFVVISIPSKTATFYHEYSMCILSITMAFITLTGLFLPKVRVLYNHPHDNVQSDSLKSRTRSLSSRSSHKDFDERQNHHRRFKPSLSAR